MRKPFTGKQTYDTMRMGRDIMNKKFFKLKDLAYELFSQKQIDNNFTFHSAMDDTEITTNCFCFLHSNNYKY